MLQDSLSIATYGLGPKMRIPEVDITAYDARSLGPATNG
jgi:hypothetical protein